MFDLTTLARLQFALTVSFHYIYPPLSIGLGWFLVVLEALYFFTHKEIYHQICKYWVGIFGLIFGIGVATGIVMEFEFGTNWATYSRYVGDVFGSALAAEGLFAFFLESGFFAVLVFGWNKVSKGMHFFATLMVALGATFSAVWIVIANSWQQTPAGYHIVEHGLRARAEITDFWAMVWNPSSMDRLSHVLFGSILAAAFLVLSVGAYYLIRRQFVSHAKTWMPIGLAFAVLGIVGQVITGHSSAIGVAHNQPAKLAALEGHWHSDKPGALCLLGWVHDTQMTTEGVCLPGGLSFLLYGNIQTSVPGLLSIPPADRPPVNWSFQLYHLMLYCAGAMAALTALCVFFFIRGRLYNQRWLLCLLVPSVLLPQVANQAGWYTAEIGRQPWVVYGLLRTSDALSKVVTANQVLASIVMFSLVYLLLFALFIYLLNDKIHHGPVSTRLPHSARRADVG